MVWEVQTIAAEVASYEAIVVKQVSAEKQPVIAFPHGGFVSELVDYEFISTV